jgi:hypothetical protein
VDRIDAAIIGGEPLRRIAERFGRSHSSIARHKQNCVAQSLFEARQQRRLKDTDYLLAQAQQLDRQADQLRRSAEERQELKTAVAAVGERRRILALQTGMVQATTVEHGPAPEEDTALLETILSALDDFPEARQAVAEILSPAPVGGTKSLATTPHTERLDGS